MTERPGTVREVFTAFLKLGLTSFGGPVAHLAFFQTVFVRERQWLDSRAYAELVALCQFLPGPASSQVGMAIGLHRAGAAGAVAAWLAFTAPSALLMITAGLTLSGTDLSQHAGLLQGLKAAAVGVVAWAIWNMARSLTPDFNRLLIAALACLLALFVPTVLGQLAGIALGAVLAHWLVPASAAQTGSGLRLSIGRRGGLIAGALFLAGLLGLPLLAGLGNQMALTVLDSMYRAGALVFGGGHIVLPLLHAETVQTGMISSDTFLAGYGLAQAMPGPLFSFAGLIGSSAGGIGLGILAVVAIFLPGSLLVLAILPFWERVRGNHRIRLLLGGVNAAVVGILAAAFYDPVMTAGLSQWRDGLVAVGVIAALAWGRIPVWLLILLSAGAGSLFL
ncbi:chromate efflux transporter [Methylonatrum kenyense]|uniref:chromate efflux transporter n=1 Tax=Methylonatrum kenyense TaxID=455253 RepID=UPI0020BD6A13|nr:chromate efflux transporter [Methylonatrum kenyense]